MSSLSTRISDDLKKAMLAKDAPRTGALRLIRAEILKREKEKIGSVLDDPTVAELLQNMVKQRRDSIEQYEAGARKDLADQERYEVSVISEYLPAGLSDDEMHTEIDRAIATSGAKSAADLGRVMGPLMKALKATGKPFDGNRVNAMVKEKLQG